MEYWDHQDVRDVDSLSGACMLVRSAAVPDSPLLDETLPMYFEDIDLCRRLRAEGWRIRFLGNAEAVHVGRLSSEQSPGKTRLAVMEQGDAVWLYFRRHRGSVQAALSAAMIGFGAVIRLAFRLFQRVVGILPDSQSLQRETEKHIALLRWAIRPGKPHMTSL